MTKKGKKTKNLTNGANSQSLREIITKESRFITELLDRIPSSAFDEDKEEGEEANMETEMKLGLPGPSNISNDEEKANNRARSLEELKVKLEGLQGKKLSYKNKLAKKGLKNKLKKKKKNEERLLVKKQVRAQKSGDRKPDIISSENTPVKPVKPVFNSEGKLVFSKFDFSEVGRKDSGKKEERDPKKILKQMEKQKEKLQKLQSEGATEKVQELKEKMAWQLALKKTQGVKVKDDPELLKKSVKRLEHRKKHSAKKWKGREDTLRKQQEERQKKRTNSLQHRKDQNKQTKMKKAIKKGRVIPGF